MTPSGSSDSWLSLSIKLNGDAGARLQELANAAIELVRLLHDPNPFVNRVKQLSDGFAETLRALLGADDGE